MDIKIKKLHKDAKAPTYETPGAAGADVYACIEEAINLRPGETAMIPLGFSMEIPEGYAAFLLPRSGLGAKKGIVLGNLVGVVDSDFRGEVHACVWNRNNDHPMLMGAGYCIKPNERIGQMVIQPIVRANFIVTDELSDTERGSGGFGSTDRKGGAA